MLMQSSERYGLTAVLRPNEIGNCYHSYVQAPPFSLTESCVGSPGEVVRRAVFREGYSQANTQLVLFEEEVTEVELTRPVYAVILHGPHPQQRQRPGFMWVRYPHPGFDAYLPERLDLQALVKGTMDFEVPQDTVEERLELAWAEQARALESGQR
jgi:hypothetical protein